MKLDDLVLDGEKEAYEQGYLDGRKEPMEVARLRQLVRLCVAWNCHQVAADEAMDAIWHLFRKECLIAWNARADRISRQRISHDNHSAQKEG